MQRRIYTALIILLGWSIFAMGQTQAERKAIKQLCGCFEVDFRYTETFTDHEDYEFHDPYAAHALELVILEEESPTKMVLQHVLVINDTTFIKHWRQDWEYQPKELFTFQGNNVWEAHRTSPKASKGQWSQEVYGVNDEPRYSGAATWFLADGKKVWENTSNAPLPRRDYSKRSDYQIMRRTNGHIIHDWGWVHEQDNQKIVLSEDGEKVLVEEKGRNTYRRTDENRCAKAAEWWQTKKDFWTHVRADWDEFLAAPNTFTVQHKVEDVRFTRKMRDLKKAEFNSGKEARIAIQEVMNAYRTPIDKVNQ
ncbi:MAG: DUF6607 family protein [Bacteroidota bacterium]